MDVRARRTLAEKQDTCVVSKGLPTDWCELKGGSSKDTEVKAMAFV